MTLPGMVWTAVVRSPYAHAKIRNVDVSEALEAEGVVAAFSGADLAEDWAATLPCVWLVTEDATSPSTSRSPRTRRATRATASRSSSPRAARSRRTPPSSSRSSTSRSRPSSTSRRRWRTGADRPRRVRPNHSYTWTLQTGEIDRLFSEAPVTVKERYRQQRLIPNAIEPRGVLVHTLPATDEYTLWSATQMPHIARLTLSGTTGIPETRLRVVAPDVGGGFGSKLNVYAEEALASRSPSGSAGR